MQPRLDASARGELSAELAQKLTQAYPAWHNPAICAKCRAASADAVRGEAWSRALCVHNVNPSSASARHVEQLTRTRGAVRLPPLTVAATHRHRLSEDNPSDPLVTAAQTLRSISDRAPYFKADDDQAFTVENTWAQQTHLTT